MKSLILAAFATVCLTAQANAAAFFTFTETGTGVLGSLSGSLDTATALVRDPTVSDPNGTSVGVDNTPAITPTPGNVGIVSSAGLLLSDIAGNPMNQFLVTGPDPFAFGTGGFITADAGSRTGDFSFELGTLPNGIEVLQFDQSYVSGEALSGSMFFTGLTFADMGLAVGDSVFSLSNQDTFTVRVAAVPLPASLPLLAAGLGLIGFMRRRKA